MVARCPWLGMTLPSSICGTLYGLKVFLLFLRLEERMGSGKCTEVLFTEKACTVFKEKRCCSCLLFCRISLMWLAKLCSVEISVLCEYLWGHINSANVKERDKR